MLTPEQREKLRELRPLQLHRPAPLAGWADPTRAPGRSASVPGSRAQTPRLAVYGQIWL